MGTTVLITSTNEKRSYHGTGFVVFNDNENGSFIVTCRHVIKDCLGKTIDTQRECFKIISEDLTKKSWKNIVLVDGKYADLIAFGTDKKDLAVIYVKGLEKTIPFELCMNSLIIKGKNIPFQLEGFDTNELKSLKDTRGLIVKRISRGVTHFRLKSNIDSSPIEGGNSGSAIVTLGTNKVIGVLVAEDNDEEVGLAISIEYVKDIWKEMPIEVWVKCNYKLSISKHKKNMFISLLKFFGIGVVVFLLFMFLELDKEPNVKHISLLSSPSFLSFKELAKDEYDLGNYEKAKEYYNQAISEDPHNGQLYSDLGLTYSHLASMYDVESLKISKLAIEKSKNKPNIQASSFYNIGKVYERQRNYSEALKNYEKALERREHKEYHKRIKSMKEKLGIRY